MDRQKPGWGVSGNRPCLIRHRERIDAGTHTEHICTISKWHIDFIDLSHISADGLTVNAIADTDGDGDTDVAVSDVTVQNPDGTSVETVVTSNGDGSQRSKTVTTTSADGLTVTQLSDVSGTTAYDLRQQAILVNNANGSTTRTETIRSGDDSTLLSQTVTQESADRLSRTVSSDLNGDGVVDLTIASVEAQNGSQTITVSTYKPNGALSSRTVSSVSANDLIHSDVTDANGDGISETNTVSTTVLQANGQRVTTVVVNNGDGTLRSQSVATVSDDRLTTEIKSDADANGVFEQRAMVATTFARRAARKPDDHLFCKQ